MFKKQEFRIIGEILLGIVISVIFNFLCISFGYYKINADKLDTYSVSPFGLEIFQIKNGGNSGSPVVTNMMYIGIIFSILMVIVVEVIIGMKKRHHKEVN